jgi:hypothetical protein
LRVIGLVLALLAAHPDAAKVASAPSSPAVAELGRG